MFKMVNKDGNAIRYVKTKEKREALIELGYREEKEEPKQKTKENKSNKIAS